jgi:N-acetylglutamate synthase-like GNAT family acetyltransferase
MNPYLYLKPAKRHDAHNVTKLFTHVYEETKKEKVIEMIKKRRVYVLKRKKKIVAAFSYSVFGFLGIFAVMYIHRIAVLPDMQGQGFGTLLLTRIKGMSAKAGITLFLLYSLKNVQDFYRKNKLNSVWRFFWWSHYI